MLDRVLDYLKTRRYWPVIEPFVLVAIAWGTAQTFVFRWLAASSSFEPSIELYVGSYWFKRITIVALGLAAILLIARPYGQSGSALSRVGAYWQAHRRSIMYRTLGIACVIAAVAVLFQIYSPNRASNITVRFMALESTVEPQALAYIVYELNRLQVHWHFNVDFEPFSDEELTSVDAKACRESERPWLCRARAVAAGEPFIGITSEALGRAYFAEHLDGISMITTADRAAYAPLSSYEYLVFSLILQSIAIHLDLYGGLPQNAFVEQRVTHGGLLQLVPEKRALKSSILAARLSPDEEALLLNRFGADYVATCQKLLTMDWLYSERVRGNLEQIFAVHLAGRQQ